MKTYTTRSGAIQRMQSFGTIQAAMEEDHGTGFCLACGASQTCVEPDARRYPCASCAQPKVYGAEELLLMALYY